jgi:hypothetical protein
MEVLTAFIREHSREPWPPSDAGQPVQERSTRPDVQAAATVVGRRDKMRDIPGQPPDLVGANLTRADLNGAHLGGANLARADLTSADLPSADLTDADLTDADLTDANFTATKWSAAAPVPEGWTIDGETIDGESGLLKLAGQLLELMAHYL